MDRSNVLSSFKFQNSTFLSCEKDTEEILRKLFITSKPYSDTLKRLLVINTKDCLDNTTSEVYKQKIQEMSLKKLREDGYIRLEPKLYMPEHEEIKSYLMISFSDFENNGGNEKYRDCLVQIDIMCHTDYWDLGNFRLRPLKIAGYIDGILNNSRLSGIGTFQFQKCSQLILSNELSGYSLFYYAVHGIDDKIEDI